MIRWILIALTVLAVSPLSRAEPTDAEKKLFQKGQKALEDTVYSVAEVYYLNLLNQFPKSELKPDAQVGLAQALYFQKKYREAANILEPGIKTAPKRLLSEYRFWLGENDAKLGRVDEAVKYLEAILKETPLDARADDARYSLAWSYSHQGRFDDATTLLKTVQKTQRQELAARASLGLAMIPYFQKNLDEAERNLAAVIQNYPKTPAAIEAECQLAQIAFEKGRDADALQKYEEVVDTDLPGTGEFVDEALLRIGDIDEKQKRYSDAMGAYERAFKKTQFEAVQLQAIEKFSAAAEKGERVDAAVDKLKAWGDDPKYPMSDNLRLAAIRLLHRTGKNERALQDIDQFIQDFPQGDLLAEAYLEKGGILEQSNSLEQALVAYQKASALARGPDLQAECYFKTAKVLRAQGNVDEASKMYQRASALKGVDDLAAQAIWENGQTQLKAQNYDGAAATFDKLAKKFPEEIKGREAVLQIANIALLKGQFDQAIQGYEAYLDKYKDKGDTLAPRAFLGKIQALSRKPDWPGTLKASQEFLKAYPDHEYAASARLYRGLALQATDKPKDALKEFEALAKDRPNTEAGAIAQMRLGEFYFGQKNYARAQEQFALVGKNFAGSAVAPEAAYFAALSAYRLKQNLDDAKKMATRFLELYPNSPHALSARMLQGDILTEQQDYAGALVVYKNLIEGIDVAKRPDLTPIYLNALGRKGELLRILEKYDDAIAAFQTILDTPNVDLDTTYNTEVQIARCYEKKDDTAKALEHYLNVVYGDKTGPQATDSFWYAKAGLNAATLKEEQKDFSGAAKILQRLVKSNASCKPLAQERLKQIADAHKVQ